MPDENDQSDGARDEGRKSVGGDDERENREQIEETGEPKRDRLGNQDGAS